MGILGTTSKSDLPILKILHTRFHALFAKWASQPLSCSTKVPLKDSIRFRSLNKNIKKNINVKVKKSSSVFYNLQSLKKSINFNVKNHLYNLHLQSSVTEEKHKFQCEKNIRKVLQFLSTIFSHSRKTQISKFDVAFSRIFFSNFLLNLRNKTFLFPLQVRQV